MTRQHQLNFNFDNSNFSSQLTAGAIANMSKVNSRETRRTKVKSKVVRALNYLEQTQLEPSEQIEPNAPSNPLDDVNKATNVDQIGTKGGQKKAVKRSNSSKEQPRSGAKKKNRENYRREA